MNYKGEGSYRPFIWESLLRRDERATLSAVDNSINIPPEDYDRKVKIQNIRLFETSS